MPTKSDRKTPCTITGAVTMKLPSGPSVSFQLAKARSTRGEADA